MAVYWPLVFMVCFLVSSATPEDGAEFCTEDTRDACDEARNTTQKMEEYGKLRWTDSADWAIHEELDAADDLIGSEPEQAVELFQ